MNSQDVKQDWIEMCEDLWLRDARAFQEHPDEFEALLLMEVIND